MKIAVSVRLHAKTANNTAINFASVARLHKKKLKLVSFLQKQDVITQYTWAQKLHW